VVYHIAKKDFPRTTALTLATFGIEKTLYFKTRAPGYERTYEMLEVLKHLDFFESLTAEKAQEFVTIIEERRVEKGKHIIRKGEEGKYFFIIRSGNVSIRDEELIDHKVLGTYEYFGEVAILSEVPRTADVVAETDVSLYAVEKDKFLSFIYGTQFEKTLRRLVANRSSETWNIMASSPTLQHLTSYQRTWMESILASREYKGAGVLVKEGKSLEQFFVIRDGKVEVSRNGRVVAGLGRGDCIGAMHRIHGDELAEFTVSYKNDLKLFTIERQDVLDFIEGNPGVGMKLTYDYTLRD
jgi:CRP-like cAMP-binding protein